MAGGLIQLMAYGSQNQFLMGNPQITFFRMVYRRHTNFSMESIKQFFNNKSELTNDGVTKITCKIDRHGDLISNIYFSFILPDIILVIFKFFTQLQSRYLLRLHCLSYQSYLKYRLLG